MPGLSLTLEQASRLLGIHRDICSAVLHQLVREGILCHTPCGRYVWDAPTADRDSEARTHVRV